ncbi:MFS transporter [Microbacterium sp. RD1]|uniref:MFS transporter n=1 Tax=Microbacterium sp. RD1 TaxID=3457313 RepID=UPI003FA5DC56
MSTESPTRSAFTVVSFRRLWAAGLVSDAGDWLLFVALPLVVLQLTSSALGTAVAFLLELAPAVVLAPLAARLAQRYDRRRVMVLVNVGQAVALLPLLLVDAVDDVPLLFAVIAAHASLAALFEPAKNSLLPDLVGPHQLVSANALIGLNQNLGRLAGGPVGGLLLAFGGLGVVVLVDVATYLVSAALIATVRPANASLAAAHDAGGVWAALLLPRLRAVFGMIVLASVAQGMFQVLFVLFVVGPLGGGEADVGLLRGIQAVGAIAAGLALGILSRRADATALAAGSTLAFGLLSLAVWNLPLITTELWPYVVLFAVVGAPGVVMVTAFVSRLQGETTPSERGPVFAAMGVLFAVGQGAGLLLGGLAESTVGLWPLLQLQGALYLAAGLVGLVTLRRRVDD